MHSDDDIADSVARHGWHAISVSDGPAPFVYTCGLLTTFEHPELITFDADPKWGYSVLAAMVEDVRGGRCFKVPGAFGGVLISAKVATRPVDPTQHEFFMGYAMGHCRHMHKGELRAVQVFWPDEAGLFPFDAGCSEDCSLAQPRLDLQLTPDEISEFRDALGS